MKVRIDLIGAGGAGMELGPDLAESHVVGAAAERARPVAGGERRRLVEEEELREPAGLHQRPALPAAELQAACDPALAVVAPPDPPLGVVEAAAVAVDEASRWIGDEVAERRHTVLARHPADDAAVRRGSPPRPAVRLAVLTTSAGQTVTTTFPCACPWPRYASASPISSSWYRRSITGVTFPSSSSCPTKARSSRSIFVMKKTA